MSRPEPKVLTQHIKEDGLGVLQVCQAEAQGLFVVLYQNKPFQLRSKANIEVEYPGWKYLRVAFANSAHAFRLANKLNIMFDTKDFTIKEMTQGRTINPW